MGEREEGLLDKVKGRMKKTAGDLTGDRDIKQEGGKEEKRGEAKEDLADAQEDVKEKSQEVQRRS